MADLDEPISILSHSERAIARSLRDDPDASPAQIAADRALDERAVAEAIARIRDKTFRAAVTLGGSPFAAEVLDAVDPSVRARILAAAQ